MPNTNIPKVSNLTSNNGNDIANQFRIVSGNTEYFQSYRSVIVKIERKDGKRIVTLDSYYWNDSVTTGKYRNLFLGETKKETEAKIKSGEYKLADLNA